MLATCWFYKFGCILATYTVLKRHVGASLGLDVGNLQVLWGLLGQVFVLYVGILLVLLCLLDRVWCCMLATYRSLLGRVWVGLMGAIGPILALYLGNLVFTDTPVLL